MGSRSTAGRREPLRFLSLCSGIGGIDLAAEMAGMRIVGQVEIDPYCRRVLAKHWPNVKRVDDIRKVWGYDFGSVDVVAGGIPCQPFSVAGKRRGASDDRYLWPEMLRIVQIYEPAWVIVENVAGFVGMALDRVLTDLGAAGYETRAFVLPAAAVCAPHKRERCFIVAHAQCVRRERREGGSTWEYQHAHQWARQETAAHAEAAGARGNGVADANQHSGGWSQRAGCGDVGSASPADAGDEGYPQWHTAQCGSEGMADANSSYSAISTRQAGRREPGSRRGELAVASGARLEGRRTRRAARQSGQTQSRMGGDSDGLSRGLDGGRRDNDAFTEYPRHCWPAGPSEPQAPWEPPRTVTGTVPNRAARLKALGNAVVPQQVFPILAAIVAAEREANHASA